jgi:hypothetical protein
MDALSRRGTTIMGTKYSANRVAHRRTDEPREAQAPANDNDPSSQVNAQKLESFKFTIAVCRLVKIRVDGRGRTSRLAALVALGALALLYFCCH